MPSPQTLLPWLLGGVIGAAGILQGLHWRAEGSAEDRSGLRDQLRLAGEENKLLRRENESLRSLAQGGGELAVPQEFRERVEKESGLRFLSSPVVHKIASVELGDRISAAIESRFGPSGIDDRQDAYKLIGWLRVDDDLLSELAAARSTGARGWFDDVSGEGWVTERFDLKNIQDQAALVSLLTRIVLNQSFPPPPAYPGDDPARAREALHQGAATGAESRFYAANALSIGFVPMTSNNEAVRLMASLPVFLQGLASFPTTEGKGLADSLHVGGDDKFQAAFRNPPQTTRAILHPGEPVAAPQALELPAPPEEPFLTESAGQLGLRLWLAPHSAQGIADSWKNDRYILFPDGEKSTAVLWDIELENAAAADKLQAAALAIIGGKEGAAPPEGRHITVTRPSPVRVRYLNTFEAATSAKLAGG